MQLYEPLKDFWRFLKSSKEYNLSDYLEKSKEHKSAILKTVVNSPGLLVFILTCLATVIAFILRASILLLILDNKTEIEVFNLLVPNNAQFNIAFTAVCLLICIAIYSLFEIRKGIFVKKNSPITEKQKISTMTPNKLILKSAFLCLIISFFLILCFALCTSQSYSEIAVLFCIFTIYSILIISVFFLSGFQITNCSKFSKTIVIRLISSKRDVEIFGFKKNTPLTAMIIAIVVSIILAGALTQPLSTFMQDNIILCGNLWSLIVVLALCWRATLEIYGFSIPIGNEQAKESNENTSKRNSSKTAGKWIQRNFTCIAVTLILCYIFIMILYSAILHQDVFYLFKLINGRIEINWL